MIFWQYYAGSKQKSYIMRIIKKFAALDKAKPNKENVKGFQYGGGKAEDDSSDSAAVRRNAVR